MQRLKASRLVCLMYNVYGFTVSMEGGVIRVMMVRGEGSRQHYSTRYSRVRYCLSRPLPKYHYRVQHAPSILRVFLLYFGQHSTVS